MKKTKIPTHSPSLVSCGKLEIKLLKSILALDGKWLNIRQFHIKNKVARSTIYSSLHSLRNKEMLEFKTPAMPVITEKGVAYLKQKNHYRTVCRSHDEKSFVRDHKFTFEVPVRSYPKDWEHNMVQVIDNDYVQTSIQNFSKNNPLLKLNFEEEVNVIVTTTKVIVKPKNIFVNDHIGAAGIAIERAFNVLKILEKSGFDFKDDKQRVKLIQKEGHYAEVNSLLAQFFEKHTKGFCVTDKEGRAEFWVDHSDDHLEDETPDEEKRENLGYNMSQLMKNEYDFKEGFDDLKVLKEIAQELTKQSFITNERLQRLETQIQPPPVINQGEIPGYLG